MTCVAMKYGNRDDIAVPDVVYAFPDGEQQAQAFAQRCRAQIGTCQIHHFPDRETLVTVAPSTSLAGRTVAIYRSLHEPNAKFIELLLAADALRALGAAKLILIAPYLPYMRQDRAFKPGQSVSQKTIGRLLANAFDALITVQPHLHRTKSLSAIFDDKPARDLSAGRIIGAHLQANSASPSIIVGPDEESEDLIRGVTNVVGFGWFVARKVRHGDDHVDIELPADLNIDHRPIVIVDDIISSGGTIATLARALKVAGAGDITVYVVHALFDEKAAALMSGAGVSRVISLNTVPHVTNVIDVVDLICADLGWASA